MDATQKLVTVLLKAAATGQPQPLPEGSSLEEILPVVKKQGLGSIVYEGACLCGIPDNTPAMQELLQLYYRILLQSERQMQKVKAVCRAFEENGIDYLPFKGCTMKSLYPRQELRPMGDADILIRFAQYPSICRIMEQLGLEKEYESDCELIWKCPELYLELHQCLVQPSHRDYYAYFGDGWDRAVHREGFRYDLSPEDTYVFLVMHYAKHYRSGGIGCRHVLDLWVFRRANPDLDEAYVARELEKLHLSRFYENTLRLLEHWFGEGQTDEVVEFMTRRIFSGGAFGSSRDYNVFVELLQAGNADRVSNTRLRYYRNLLFPGMKHMQNKYPILEKHPYLLPAAWIYRGGVVLLGRREKLKKANAVGMQVSDDALNAHQDALRFVGLDYHG